MSDTPSTTEEHSQENATARETLETLSNLENMANSTLDHFNARILNRAGDAAEIPIDKIVSKTRFIRAYSSTPEKIPDEIHSCIKAFASGPMGTEIKEIAENAAQQLAGTSPGQRAVIEQSLDVCFFSYIVKTKSVAETCQVVLACCVAVSSVAVADIEENTLRVIVRNSFYNHSPAVKKLVFDEMFWKILRKRDETPLTEEEQGELRNHKSTMEEYWKTAGKA
ncbi:hypothetical protein SLS55_002772 [Diplodia seriata]|uniref:Uncharacterized protein n=1 Tax=Diplodia seriata TaxID=420778 RepID=A0ABR3CL33_9PEZI